jgi:hypothetical protein
MTHHWDEFSISLAKDPLPRRQSLRLLGAAIAGGVFSPLGTAWGAGPDPCKAFCNQCPKSKRSQCLSACRACNGNTSRLGGSCGNYVCCPSAVCNGVCSDLTSDPNCGACGNDCRDYGETCCGTYCADLENDFDNCGSCGFRCPAPGPYEFGECIGGDCLYACVEGAVRCNGVCSSLDSDPNNCGACGNVCPDSAPVCHQGVCFDPGCAPGLTWCQLTCVDLLSDNYNCGACNNQCPGGTACESGFCVGTCIGC